VTSSLEMTERHADAIAAALLETTPDITAPLAKGQATALARVFQTITDETVRRTCGGDSLAETSTALRPVVAVLGTISKDCTAHQPATTGRRTADTGDGCGEHWCNPVSYGEPRVLAVITGSARATRPSSSHGSPRRTTTTTPR